jgi:hypothetical protein
MKNLNKKAEGGLLGVKQKKVMIEENNIQV